MGEAEDNERTNGNAEAEIAEDDTSRETDDAATLEERVHALESERDELTEELATAQDEIEDLTHRLKRKAADFENYKKRQERQRNELTQAATDQLIERLLDVRDNLKRAIVEETDDPEGLREGVKLTLAEFDKVLDAEEVSEIDPAPGESVDPEAHEVMLRVDSEQPENHIAEVYQPGYRRNEKVLRPAQVTVSEGQDEENQGDDDADADRGTVEEE